jgi:excisionase family DNA binding protein
MELDPEKQPRFLTIEQVAEELSVGVPLVRTLLKTGELRGIQIGGRGLWRIGTADVEAYISTPYERTTERIQNGEIQDTSEDGLAPFD